MKSYRIVTLDSGRFVNKLFKKKTGSFYFDSNTVKKYIPQAKNFLRLILCLQNNP